MSKRRGLSDWWGYNVFMAIEWDNDPLYLALKRAGIEPDSGVEEERGSFFGLKDYLALKSIDPSSTDKDVLLTAWNVAMGLMRVRNTRFRT
ncbi:MAG: hypothetical protein G01um101416_1207 [Microgenomates group bacterium Gr01-1014_16]|nr:MAG: hypothetical protein G01um101416_1207 [Microgenomates group bacterium Gr01-1014_16]